jgi:predicted nucleotide-binding protein (sugar kinase/HSP70/actin superfamily)
MGAYGAALYAREHCPPESTLLRADALKNFTHEVSAVTCRGCTNRCILTVNTFGDGRKFIGGNQCDRPVGRGKAGSARNLYAYKRELLAAYASCLGERETVGLPLGLNLYELLPFWHTFFRALGFGVRVSPASSRRLYTQGQGSIPSDTVCYPAKLLHGHIEALLRDGVSAIFYPCMSYNIDEGLGSNHYNCPVVAYYPEVIAGNVKNVRRIRFIHDYVGLHRRKDFPKKIHAVLRREFGDIPLAAVREASEAAFAEYAKHMEKIRRKGEEYLAAAAKEKLPVVILAGRPYHIDGEISHGIDKLICDLGAVLISEDALGGVYEKTPVEVLDQWAYHSRLYAAARFAAGCGTPGLNLVQLVSFGCGLDAVTTDEVRRILEQGNKIYTQIKIDEITNLAAVKIRLRSLFAAAGQKEAINLDR